MGARARVFAHAAHAVQCIASATKTQPFLIKPHGYKSGNSQLGGEKKLASNMCTFTALARLGPARARARPLVICARVLCAAEFCVCVGWMGGGGAAIRASHLAPLAFELTGA